MKRQKTVRPYCDRMSERERRDIVTALRNIVFLEDDETGEEYCEVNDILDALDVHTEVDWTLGRDEVERLIDMVSVPQTGPRKYKLMPRRCANGWQGRIRRRPSWQRWSASRPACRTNGSTA